MDVTTSVPVSFINRENYIFSWVDYTVFGVMLCVSAVIGLYFAFCGKQHTAKEYLMGGKTMAALPIAISLIASDISTTTLLAVPADVYRYGANYIWLGLSTIIECTMAYYIFLPVFFKLQVTSSFEYLYLRFNKNLRILASSFGVLAMYIFCPIVIYVPSLAFSQVTGVDVHLIAVVTSLVCVFYTSIGGIKAVVWTDTFQFFIMLITFVTIFFIALASIGGFDVMWNRSVEGHRLDVLDFSFNPTLRDSFGALIIGGTTLWLSYTGVSSTSVQKFLSVSTFRDTKKAIVVYAIGMAIIHVFAALIGLLLYAKYWNCDPLSTKQIEQLEQLVPHFAMEVAGKFPGLPGVFIAGVFSAGLSSLSACLNTMSAVLYQDFISPFMSINTSQRRISNILKLIVVIMGITSTLIVLILEKAKGIFPLYTALMSITTGPTLGLFALGMLFPIANSKGAMCGGLAGLIVTTWIVIQSQSRALQSSFLKPISTEGCNMTVIIDTVTFDSLNADESFFLYRLSFWYYNFIGVTITVMVGLITSCFTKHDKAPVHEDLLSPIIYPFIQKKIITDVAHDNSNGEEIQLEEVPLKN